MLWKVLKAFKSAKCYFNISPPSSLPSLLRLSLPPSHCKKWKTSLSLETCTISLFMRYLVTLPPTIVLNFDSWRKFLTYIKLYVYISIKWPVVKLFWQCFDLSKAKVYIPRTYTCVITDLHYQELKVGSTDFYLGRH